jgi:antitoxin PrlF
MAASSDDAADGAREATSTLTDRYQTTVPEPVRRALNLGKRDRIRYVLRPDGGVELQRASQEDPVLAGFLEFLARDMAARPGDLRAVDAGLKRRIDELAGGVDVDLDAPLDDDDPA